MGIDLSARTWDDIERLYRDLEAAERAAPGSPDAVDLEQAINRLLDGSHENDSPEFRRRNAVRRARYGRRRAAQQRAAAAARLAPPPQVRTGPHLRQSRVVPLDPPAADNTESSVVAADVLARITAVAAGTPHGREVLLGLLEDRPSVEIAARAGLSARTVARSVARLRAAALVAAAA